MIDVVWMGRALARNPIRVRSAEEIEYEARWGRTIRGLIFVGKAAAIAGGFIVLVILWGCV